MKKCKMGILLGAITSISALGGVCAFMKKKKTEKGVDNIQKTAVYSDMPDNIALANPKYRDKIKRCLDLAICIPATVVAAIPMVLVGIAVKLDSPGPILFRQKRLGLHGEEFEMLKFRSMCVGAEHTGSGVYSGAGDARVTRVGSRLSTKEQKNLQRNGNTAFCGVFFLPIFRFCPYYGYQHA